MFRFTIRDLLWLTVVVGLAVALYRQSQVWQRERGVLIHKHEAALDNERRLGELRAREAFGMSHFRRPGDPTPATSMPVAP